VFPSDTVFAEYEAKYAQMGEWPNVECPFTPILFIFYFVVNLLLSFWAPFLKSNGKLSSPFIHKNNILFF